MCVDHHILFMNGEYFTFFVLYSSILLYIEFEFEGFTFVTKQTLFPPPRLESDEHMLKGFFKRNDGTFFVALYDVC